MYQGEVFQYKPGTRDWVESTQSETPESALRSERGFRVNIIGLNQSPEVQLSLARTAGRKERRESGASGEHTHAHRRCKRVPRIQTRIQERYQRVQLCTVKFKVPVEYSRLYEEVWYSRVSFGNHRTEKPGPHLPLETDRGVEDRQVEQSDFVAKEPAPRALLEHTRSALAARGFFAARFLGVFVNKTGSQQTGWCG